MSIANDQFILTEGAPSAGVQATRAAGFGPLGIINGGFFNYADVETTATPINVPSGNTFVPLTNDEQGTTTEKDFAPTNVVDVWDAINDEVDFSELSLGSMTNIGIDLDVTTTTSNQEFSIELELGIGQAGSIIFPFVTNQNVKSASTIRWTFYTGVYISNQDVIDNPGEFRIKSGNTATVVVNAFYFMVLRKGYVLPS